MATFTGSGSTSLTNYSSFGNVNYRFHLSDQYWIEPTVGYNYTWTEYGSNAALLGLSNGSLLRVQGGARFGIESMWDRIRVTTTVTGAAPHHLIADAPLLSYRRTRAGDAHAAGQRPRTVGLGLPAVGRPPVEPTTGCAR